MSINISWLDAITNKVINPESVEDLVFRNAALLAYLRKNRFKPYDGGVSMDDAFLYAPMIGGSYALGDPLSTDVVDPIAGQTFPPRTYYVTVAHWLEHLAINRGPAAVFDALRIKHRAAVNTLNAIWEVALFRHGQPITTGVLDDRTKETNGLDEAFNDGRSQGPFGNYYPSYAGQSRTDAGIDAVDGYKSVPYFVGDQVTGAGGEINYHHTLQSYLRYSQGDRMPDIGLTSKYAFGFLLERIQNQQVFEFKGSGLGENAVFGATSIKFMKADIMVSDYCPSTLNGKNDPAIGNYLLSSFASVASNLTNQALTHLPGDGTTVTPGEALYWINSQTLKFRLSSHPLFKFGWKGYVPQSNGTKIVGQVLSMGTETCNAPWLNGIVFGIVR